VHVHPVERAAVINFFNLDSQPLKRELVFAPEKYGLDFADVKGQENIKRALEIAAPADTPAARSETMTMKQARENLEKVPPQSKIPFLQKSIIPLILRGNKRSQ
jgi:hypothetical protein